MSEDDFVQNKIKLKYQSCSLEEENDQEEPTGEELEALDFKSYPTLEPYMFSKLKFKCSITLYSMIESRKDDDIVLRMSKSLQDDVIKRNLRDNFLMYRDQYEDKYDNEMFEHFTLEPSEENNISKYKCSFIIQTAFNLYIMYLAFVDAAKKNNPDADGKDDDNIDTGSQEYTEALKFYQSCY